MIFILYKNMKIQPTEILFKLYKLSEKTIGIFVMLVQLRLVLKVNNQSHPFIVLFIKLTGFFTYASRTIYFIMSCYSCGQRGHLAKECQSGQVCFNCSQPGHIARDCQQPALCHNCKSPDHMSYDCTEPKPEREPRSDACYECGQSGHFAYACPDRQAKRGGNACYSCGEEGHRQYECPNRE